MVGPAGQKEADYWAPGKKMLSDAKGLLDAMFAFDKDNIPDKVAAHSVDKHSQTYAATHNICGLCVPRRQCPVVPLSLRLKRESELQVFSCVLTVGRETVTHTSTQQDTTQDTTRQQQHHNNTTHDTTIKTPQTSPPRYKEKQVTHTNTQQEQHNTRRDHVRLRQGQPPRQGRERNRSHVAGSNSRV